MRGGLDPSTSSTSEALRSPSRPSMPVLKNGLAGVTLREGRSPISCCGVAARHRTQEMQRCNTDLTKDRPRGIQ